MARFGFVIDNRKCIGCHACSVACKSEHEVPVGVDRTWVKYVEKGTFPHSRRLFTVMRCNHCDSAPCVTICPVTSLYRREDGVVDFNPERCIGCKSCLQACPYDALYIDPENNTAAKCNYCTHRLEVGLEPSCVVVCPEQAIIAGDLDDPLSEITQLIDRHPVQVRKPEKGTLPKLFYIDGDAEALVPNRTGTQTDYLWSSSSSSQPPGAANPAAAKMSLPVISKDQPRRVYDVRARPPAWDWKVVGYTWTKAIASGAFLSMLLMHWAGQLPALGTQIVLGMLALLFLALTGGLLIADLKQPKRFLYVLLRPQWKSWLVRGAYIITGYGTVLTLWMASAALEWNTSAEILFWLGVLLAVLSAVYTAFLLSQAKGRDFWQNPLLSAHLLTHALLAAGSAWLVVNFVSGAVDAAMARLVTASIVTASLLVIFGELVTVPPTEDARKALDMITTRPFGQWFWLVGIGLGHIVPLIFLLLQQPLLDLGAVVFVLIGVYVIEHLWISAPQKIPLS